MSRPRAPGSGISVVGFLLASLLAAPAWAQDPSPAGQPTPSPAPQKDVTRELQELRAMRQDLQRQMGEFDARISTLEGELGVPDRSAAAPVATAPNTMAPTPGVLGTAETGALPTLAGTQAANPPGQRGGQNGMGEQGIYEPGRGFVLVRDDEGELGIGLYTYARYLNQTDLNRSYVDAFGRTQTIDVRHDIEFQKVSMNMKGWLFDPKFRYYLFFWTSNPTQGDGAQVVIGGWLAYEFTKWLNVTVGIVPLPTTHSTNWSFPNWLRNDNRVMADEFFRGSYTQGIEATGEILPGLRYRASLANNLSALGVSAKELDDQLNTQSIALWWMPTTHEFGPSFGIGDYEYHKEFATLFAVHFTHSREDAQGQPDVDVFDNTQIRLSDGTRLFSPDPFNVGAFVQKATYKMLALNAGFKYQGWHLEGEYYFRWVDNLKASGPLPVDELYDHGFAVQGSTMVIRDVLQAYATASKIYGEYGDPTEFSLGLNWFPFDRKEVRLNTQLLFLDGSPVGGTSYPQAVGGDGIVFSTDLIVAF